MECFARPDRVFPLFFLLLAPVLLLSACGSDDPADPGGQNPPDQGDTQAPIVAEFTPETGEIVIPLDATLEIRFSEPMLTSSAQGNITLSAGSITGMTWEGNDTRLSLTVSGWAEGQEVTLDVGTGLKDVAGNNLPRAFSTRFFTRSADPVLLEIQLHAETDAVSRSVIPWFQFSEAMDRDSIYNAMTISDGSAVRSVPAYQFGSYGSNHTLFRLTFLEPLDPLTTYTIDIGTAAMTEDGQHLAEAVHVVFTTTADADETGPEILSSFPPDGAVVPRDLDRMTITFSEPVNANRVEIDSLSFYFVLFGLGEPVWNDEADEMTIYLRDPLPAGVDFFISFEDESIYDWADNGNSERVSIRFTVEGEPDLFPVDVDQAWIFDYEEEGDKTGRDEEGEAMLVFDDPSGAAFERLLYVAAGDGFTELREHWLMSEATDGGIVFNGTTDEEGDLDFEPGIDYLPADMATDWSGTVTATMETGTSYLHFEGSLVESGQVYQWHFDDPDAGSTIGMYLEDCVMVQLTYIISEDQAGETVLKNGRTDTYLCPGVGAVGWESIETTFEEGNPVGTFEEGYWLREMGPRQKYE